MVLVKLCLLVVMFSSIVVSSERATGLLCTTVDTPGTCVFKGLLKIVLGYTIPRKNDDAMEKMTENHQLQQKQSKSTEAYLFEQIQNIIGLFSLGFDLPTEVTAPLSLLKSSFFSGRGKKNKKLGPMLAAGMAMMAGTLLPIAFGALFMLAGKAIMTSLLAITISGLLGLKSLFSHHQSGGNHIKAYAAPSPHYTEAHLEQELGVYKGQPDAKMQGFAANYYTGEPSLSAYYDHIKGEQLTNDSNQPDYYATDGEGGNVNRMKFAKDIENNKIIVKKNDIL